MSDEQDNSATSATTPGTSEVVDRVEFKVGELLRHHQLTFAAAESCTGGLIMHRMTNVPGSSSYLIGGLVTYSNEAKSRMLSVRAETLILHGAVSEQTAIEMVRGVLRVFEVDVAVSVTGIAGPGGGTDQKPVGLTYIALGTSYGDMEQVRRFVWSGDREGNKASSAQAALEMLYQYLLKLPPRGHVTS